MPSQAKPSQAKPSQAKPSQAKPSQAKPSQAKPSQAKMIVLDYPKMSRPFLHISNIFNNYGNYSTNRWRKQAKLFIHNTR
jgi:hypothetical protein